MDSFWGQMLAFFVAFIPGVLIALIADYLSRRRDTERERAILDGDRFWYNRFAGNRIRFFERLQRQVTETLALGNPIGDSLE